MGDLTDSKLLDRALDTIVELVKSDPSDFCDVVEYDNEVMIINTQIDSNYFQLFCLKREMCCSVCKNMIIPIPLSTLILKNNGLDITEVNCEDENPELHYETFSKCRIMADIRYYTNWSDDNGKFVEVTE